MLTMVSAAMLAGCAGIGTEVTVTKGAPAEIGKGARTYVLTNDPIDSARRDATRYRALVSTALARGGFDAVDGGQARYSVSLAYDTRLQSISVASGETCEPGGDCGSNGSRAVFSWPWQKTYVHSLTLRFFDRENGHEVYKVRAERSDHRADENEAFPYLVDSALAQLPYASEGRWDVKLRPASGASQGAGVVSATRIR
ncbi:hypothetical protein Busp01_08950 [Trinickia caryophylli]|uniref:DUF4136 domain-containing protein n=1 Tax=Trinickia caryophylli TaxID=28094 RepID=A0A1X7CZC4_TRICW|nr:hypothetical protein Busp01_08950 [Trinickia caryophylli]SMF05838.1 protein of unknown function [Trinickia caryophylli]